MQPAVTENYTDIGIDVGSIVRRILSYLSPSILDGLQEVRILDKCQILEKCKKPFACYKREERVIEIYVSEMLGDFRPFILKVFYPFTYMFIGMAVGHELDHHANRDIKNIDREASAEANIMKYIYPSLGIFKPTVRIISFIARSLHMGTCGVRLGS